MFILKMISGYFQEMDKLLAFFKKRLGEGNFFRGINAKNKRQSPFFLLKEIKVAIFSSFLPAPPPRPLSRTLKQVELNYVNRHSAARGNRNLEPSNTLVRNFSCVRKRGATSKGIVGVHDRIGWNFDGFGSHAEEGGGICTGGRQKSCIEKDVRIKFIVLISSYFCEIHTFLYGFFSIFKPFVGSISYGFFAKAFVCLACPADNWRPR